MTSRCRRAAISAGVAAVCLVCAGAASAHLRSGTVAVDYRVSITRPVTLAYSAQIYQSDHGLALTLKPGHVVVLLGYLDEPVFRLDAAGLWVNGASPTAAALHLTGRLRPGAATTPLWELRRHQRTVVWHDARVQRLPPGLSEGTWTVPLISDGRRALLQGELRRFPAPSPWPWLGVLACWLTAGTVLPLKRRHDVARPAAIGLACVAGVATVLIVIAFALDSYASPGTWIEGLDAIAFLAVGVGVLLRGPRTVHIAAAIWIGLIAIAVGLLDGAVFLHPIVLAILPGPAIRTLVVTAVGAGLDALVLGCSLFDEITGMFRDTPPAVAVPAASPPVRPGL